MGPFQTLVDAPGLDVFFVAETTGSVVDHTGKFKLEATYAFSEVLRADVIVVPGGMADSDATSDDALVQWIKAVHPTTEWTTSVCTGSIYLALAGLLSGVRATTHWARYERLRALGAHPMAERVVIDGKIITAAGVSSGIDMGLTLVAQLLGDELAKVIQLAIEYDPQPPFDSGSLAKASNETIELVSTLFAP